jgi:hypothetical protein
LAPFIHTDHRFHLAAWLIVLGGTATFHLVSPIVLIFLILLKYQRYVK